MNGKETIESAFSRGGTEQIPAVICYEGIYLRDHWNQMISHPWWYHASPDLNHQLLWRREAIAGIGQDWFYLPECETTENRLAKKIMVDGNRVSLFDARTNASVRLEEPMIGGWSRDTQIESVHPQEIPRTKPQIDRLIPLPHGFNKEDYLASGAGDLAKMLLTEFGDTLFPIRHVTGPLWACYSLWGFEEWMVMIANEPELIRYASQRQLERSLYDLRVSAALGVKGIWIEDCLVDMISRRAYKSINLPLIQTLVDEIRSLGMKSIYYYCGDPVGKLDLILETGVDAISLEESKKGFQIDLGEIADFVNGRCCLLGNLDAIHILQDASEHELRKEIQRQIDIGWRNQGRLIMSIGSPVTPGTTPERVRLYTSLVHELGKKIS